MATPAPLPPKAHFKNKQEAEREYAQEYHRLTKMTAYAPRETESPVQLFLIANTERIVQTDIDVELNNYHTRWKERVKWLIHKTIVK